MRPGRNFAARTASKAIILPALSSYQPLTSWASQKLEVFVYPLLNVLPKFARRNALALVVAGAVLAAGCHHTTSYDSGYGVGWVTVANSSGNYGNNITFASYVVTIDSILLTDAVGNQYTAIATPEAVDLVKLTNISELWGSGTVPADTYVSAAITIDYTYATVSLLVNGLPTPATVGIPTGDTALTTTTVTVNFDPANPLVISDSYATTNAQRVAMNFDLAASNTVNLTKSPAVVTASPFLTISNTASDTRLIRIRGPLVNSNATTLTYSIYERPFYDEANNIGTITIFVDNATVFTVNGKAYTGPSQALPAISQLSAGVTASEAYTRFAVTPSTLNAQGQPTNTAGIFTSVYSVIGGSLETNYTNNIEGDVIARTGNTLTLTNATLAGIGADVQLSPVGYFLYITSSASSPTNPLAVATVIIGPSTVVTAEGNNSLGTLDYNSIAVGQHITAVGGLAISSVGVWTVDAVIPTTGSTAGQVRIQNTQLFGQLQSSAAGTMTMGLQTIDGLPASLFNFAGDGTSSAQDPIASAYLVDTSNAGAADLTGLAAGTSLWVGGFTAPFGTAPPDFRSFPNLQFAPSPDQLVSGANQEAVVPASLQVVWTSPGTTAPFSSSSSTSIAIDGTNAELASAVIAIGPEIIPLASLGAPVIVAPNTVTNCVLINNKPDTQPCAPLFAYMAVTTAATSTTPALTTTYEYSSFANFVTNLSSKITTALPATQLVANGYFDRTTNTFTANNIDVVL